MLRTHLAVLALLLLGGLAVGQRTVQAAETPDYPLDQVTRGATGYALTAGAANSIERFDITVLGVQQDAGSGFPLVLVRASGEFIERVGGVAAGMSGSPVYLTLDGRDALLGAIGYVFPEADHFVALVTPIAAMRDDNVFAATPPLRPEVAGLGEALPVATPVLLSGADQRAATLLTPLFENAAVTPWPTQVGGPSTGGTAYSLEPGAAIAVRLMSGDFDLSAIGTLTALESKVGEPGHSLLAFGHPFLSLGEASYALSGAQVLEIVASRNVPFKVATANEEIIGAIDLDTPTALLGTVGSTAATLPLTLTVTAAGRQERYEVELAADERLYPVLTAVAALQGADRLLRSTSAGHADLAWQLELADGTRVNVLEQTTSDADIALAAANLAGGPLAILAQNAFAEPGLSAIELSIDLIRDPNRATIESLVLEEDPVRAGDNAIVHVRLQPYRQEALVRTFSVPLPADAEGDMTLLVRGGDVPREIDNVPEEGGEVDEPRSFPELLDALRSQLQASELVVEMIDEEGDIARLLRIALPFVVLSSEELSFTVAPEDDLSEQ